MFFQPGCVNYAYNMSLACSYFLWSIVNGLLFICATTNWPCVLFVQHCIYCVNKMALPVMVYCGYWAYVPRVVCYTFGTIILKCHKWYFVSNRTFNSCYYKFCLTISEMRSTYKQVLSWNTTPLSQSYNRNVSGGCIKVRSVVGVNVVVGLQNE